MRFWLQRILKDGIKSAVNAKLDCFEVNNFDLDIKKNDSIKSLSQLILIYLNNNLEA